MKAIVWTKYGPPDVLQLREVEKPVPRDREVLIKVRAATVTAGDCEARSFRFPPLFWLPLRVFLGIFRPRKQSPGQEAAGTVEAAGKRVTRFRPGDNIYAATLLRFGAYAEYICLPETYPMAVIPADMTFEEAATIPTGGVNGLHFLKKADIRPGDQVLINGAGGSIGTYAVQLAKSMGAEVTCVDSAGKLEMLRSIGADRVVDYAKEDFTRSGRTYDAIIDVVGKSSFSRSVQSLKPNGRYVLGNPGLRGMLRGVWTSWTTDKTVRFELADYKAEYFRHLHDQIGSGKLKPVIDRRYPLERTAEAHRYVENGHKKGNVVIVLEEHS